MLTTCGLHRGKYQGIIGVVVAFGFAIGPLIGGALAQKVSWRVSPSVSTCVQSASDKQPFADLLDVVVLLGHAPDIFCCDVLGLACAPAQVGRR